MATAHSKLAGRRPVGEQEDAGTRLSACAHSPRAVRKVMDRERGAQDGVRAVAFRRAKCERTMTRFQRECWEPRARTAFRSTEVNEEKKNARASPPSALVHQLACSGSREWAGSPEREVAAIGLFVVPNLGYMFGEVLDGVVGADALSLSRLVSQRRLSSLR